MLCKWGRSYSLRDPTHQDGIVSSWDKVGQIIPKCTIKNKWILLHHDRDTGMPVTWLLVVYNWDCVTLCIGKNIKKWNKWDPCGATFWNIVYEAVTKYTTVYNFSFCKFWQYSYAKSYKLACMTPSPLWSFFLVCFCLQIRFWDKCHFHTIYKDAAFE